MKYTFLFMFLSVIHLANGQMNNDTLEQLITEESDLVQGTSGRWELQYNDVALFVVTDENNDRMRIIAPIVPVDTLDKKLLLNCLTANFHSALDVKYAISNNVLWSVFIHPLSPLTEKQVRDALLQVSLAAINFGTTYASTNLIFGRGSEESEKKEEEKPTKLHRG